MHLIIAKPACIACSTATSQINLIETSVIALERKRCCLAVSSYVVCDFVSGVLI
jgi:hypothetical protein